MDRHPALTRKPLYADAARCASTAPGLFRAAGSRGRPQSPIFLARQCALQAVGPSDGRRLRDGITQTDLSEICGLTSVHINA